ncbi:MAG: recombinase family protein [Patescibacteria group bacterium]
MNSSHKEIKYFAYCRKSSEDSQRQVASIGDQTNALKQVAEREQLSLVRDPFTEEKSAKDPGRPIFNDVLNRIEKGEANALLCWDIDRLSRNPIDNGRLQWMLQKGVIKVIKTPGRSYYPEDAGLLMSIEGGRATDYVMRLSKNVKRGLNSKAMRGWRPSGGPIGYLNVGTEKGNKTIAIDPERFELVRKMWDLFLTGTYSVSKIREIAITEWGLTTLKHRKIGGNPPTMSHMYNIFKDTFYYGYYPWTDPDSGEVKMVKGNHPAMITEKEYRRAQVLLGRKGKPQPQTREFAFTGLMRCGECDSTITAEEKNQIICSGCKYKFSNVTRTACPKCAIDISDMENPKILNYVYYHCTKKKNKNCSQKNIKLGDLESQFDKILGDITIDREYLELALDYLQDKQKNSGGEEKAVRVSLQSSYDDCQTRLVNLSREFTSPLNSKHELYTSEEFKEQKMEIIAQRTAIEKLMGGTKEKLDSDLEIAERVFNFCTFARDQFSKPDLRKKREIFSTIGSNLILKDKILTIDKLHPYLLIENEMREQKALIDALEPRNSLALKRQKSPFELSRPTWLRR